MRRARWLAEWRKAAGKPVLFHVHSRIVDRRFVLGTGEKERFRTLMRMQENFTGCLALSYCLMDNHFHILLEVPPMAEGGVSDEGLLKRLVPGQLFRVSPRMVTFVGNFSGQPGMNRGHVPGQHVPGQSSHGNICWEFFGSARCFGSVLAW